MVEKPKKVKVEIKLGSVRVTATTDESKVQDLIKHLKNLLT
jgi:hypothetical protein